LDVRPGSIFAMKQEILLDPTSSAAIVPDRPAATGRP
jgi:hypothetical protein